MQEHKRWLLFAEGDLRLAMIGLKSEDDLVIGGVLYHCQQCIEKALKAYLVYKDEELTKTHDLVKLVRACALQDPDFLNLLSDVAEINPYATKSRYPDTVFFMPDVSVAQWAIKRVSEIFEFVKSKIE